MRRLVLPRVLSLAGMRFRVRLYDPRRRGLTVSGTYRHHESCRVHAVAAHGASWVKRAFVDAVTYWVGDGGAPSVHSANCA